MSDSCPVTVTTHEWLWLRDIKCGQPINRNGLCTTHADHRDKLGEVDGLSAHLTLIQGEAS